MSRTPRQPQGCASALRTAGSPTATRRRADRHSRRRADRHPKERPTATRRRGRPPPVGEADRHPPYDIDRHPLGEPTAIPSPELTRAGMTWLHDPGRNAERAIRRRSLSMNELPQSPCLSLLAIFCPDLPFSGALSSGMSVPADRVEQRDENMILNSPAGAFIS
jgi:hypothetical protein